MIARLAFLALCASSLVAVFVAVIEIKRQAEIEQHEFQNYMMDMMAQCEENEYTYKCIMLRPQWAQAWGYTQ